MPDSNGKINKIYEAIGGLKADVKNIDKSLGFIKDDIRTLRTDMSELKTQVNEYSIRLGSVAERVQDLEGAIDNGVEGLEDTVEVEIGKLKGDVNRLKAKYWYIIGFGGGAAFVAGIVLTVLRLLGILQ